MFTAIVPGANHDKYVLKDKVFLTTYCFSFQLIDSHELVFFQYYFGELQYRDYIDGRLYIEYKSDKTFFLYDGTNKEQLTKAESDAFLLESMAMYEAGYKIYLHLGEDLFSPDRYVFECLETGKVKELTTDARLLLLLDGYSYWYDWKNKTLLKLDASFNQVEKKEFVAEYFRFKCLGKYVCLYYSNEEDLIEIFDLEQFVTVARDQSDSERVATIFPIVKTNEALFFGCGNRLYGWDGQELTTFFPDKEVAEILDKGDFVYISFRDDPAIYAYSPDLKKCVHKQSQVVDGYYMDQIQSRANANFALLRPNNLDVIGGLSYFVTWTDEEFMSDEPWQANVEEAIFTEEHIPVGENFSVCIRVQVIDNYATVARQSLAALDEALYRHAASFNDKICSDNFTGVVELCFENSRSLTKEQRAQLVEANEKYLDEHLFYVGKATGEDCTLTVTFID